MQLNNFSLFIFFSSLYYYYIYIFWLIQYFLTVFCYLNLYVLNNYVVSCDCVFGNLKLCGLFCVDKYAPCVSHANFIPYCQLFVLIINVFLILILILILILEESQYVFPKNILANWGLLRPLECQSIQAV